MISRHDIPPDVLVAACNRGFVGEKNPSVLAEDFLARWQEATPDVFTRILQGEGERSDRVISLFASGYLAFPEAPRLLAPFLHSQERCEQWASALALGHLKESHVFSRLCELLLDGLATLSFLQDEDFWANGDWYLARCCDIAQTLGDWGNPAAIPVLGQALTWSWTFEAQPQNYRKRIDLRLCHALQNSCSYALGQCKAWDALAQVPLPPAHRSVATLYQLFGSAHEQMVETLQQHGTLLPVYQPFSQMDMLTLWADYRLRIRSEHPPLLVRQRDGTMLSPYLSPDQIKQVLHERLGLLADQQVAYLSQAWQAFAQRREEHGDQGDKHVQLEQMQYVNEIRASLASAQTGWEEVYKELDPEVYQELVQSIGRISLPQKHVIRRLSEQLDKTVPANFDTWTFEDAATHIEQLQEERDARRRQRSAGSIVPEQVLLLRAWSERLGKAVPTDLDTWTRQEVVILIKQLQEEYQERHREPL